MSKRLFSVLIFATCLWASVAHAGKHEAEEVRVIAATGPAKEDGDAQRRRVALRAALQAQRQDAAQELRPMESASQPRQLNAQERSELRQQIRQQRRETSPP
jgi:hypothetical protein